jgi:hypothetical protein
MLHAGFFSLFFFVSLLVLLRFLTLKIKRRNQKIILLMLKLLLYASLLSFICIYNKIRIYFFTYLKLVKKKFLNINSDTYTHSINNKKEEIRVNNRKYSGYFFLLVIFFSLFLLHLICINI